MGEFVYSAAINLRNARYDRPAATFAATVPVISVGNITVGGTGKTPFVIELLKRLDRLGRSPVVVARGYGAAPDEPNDEELLIRRNCPGAAYVADPDRCRAVGRAASRMGADVIVLDDGFQHRRLARDLDLVLIDATCPFGYEHVLPRGLLREPLVGLRRAHLVVITRCDQASGADLTRIASRLRDLAPDSPVIRCRHRVTAVECLDGSPVEEPIAGKRAVLFAAVGRPGAFATTVSSLGVDVVAVRWWPDHHRYRVREIKSLLGDRSFAPHDLVLTTEKDAVKLAGLSGFDRGAIGVVRVAVDFLDEGDTMLQRLLERALCKERIS
ncbi:MAG: tetraacyldisaccharide 4'-kinase [Phycisphaerales bacterium]|nr:tetraacyldisaccharide 4'-kinase [Phycisphaerales bacterium]